MTTSSTEEARHRRALVLSEVAAEGTVGLCRALRRAASDEEAAAIPVSALLHAVPGMTALDSYELMLRAHVHDKDLAGDLTPGQRVTLLELVSTTSHVRHQLTPRGYRLAP
ncbi:hypothetical protein [Actinacidiphila acidipaludis]|uniref:Uncharacterized protein n=1 Tax=Actinacidiphila acidipaludis TaxID=2873382 RepID=A0ABS7QF42_9ACTN|nr:hypothetical protein [Streptomyces acidipaludis]MBY8881757.1 hypothetical protein [Streptomyces acidipaludis]